MPGPTTEVLSDDLKDLRAEVHKIDLDVRELSTQVKGITTGIRILGIFTLASLISGVWWGASLTARVEGIGDRLNRMEAKADARIDKLEASINARIDKLESGMDDRFNRIEAALTKLAPK